MKIVLVTGGNRGIGLEICRQLDGLGHKVILGSRDLKKGLAAAGSISEEVVVRQLDVTDENSILDLFESVKAGFGKLDVLINNAGIGEHPEENKSSSLARAKNYLEENIYGVRQINKIIVPLMRKTGLAPQRNSSSDVPLSLVDHVMETNLYGPWRMIQVFIPLLMKSDDSRIINISSGMGELKSLSGIYPGYSLSKSSLNALTIMFSNELKDKGIKVNAMCPGWVKTDMGGPGAPRHVSQGADTAVWLATEMEIPTGKFFRDREEISW
jgi:NAD(P)-dependent dehydrogenase (short-subunit alcohol dehydrogenase family)